MEKVVFESLAKLIEPQLLINLIGLYFIYSLVSKLERGVRAGLLSHITNIFEGAMKNGYISMDTARIVEEDYAQYHALGGDGLADNMMELIRRLPPKTVIQKQNPKAGETK